VEWIISEVDRLCDGRSVDLILGGSPCRAYSLADFAMVGGEAIWQIPTTVCTAFM